MSPAEKGGVRRSTVQRDGAALLRKDMIALAQGHTAIVQQVGTLDTRITAIEEARRQRALDEARTEEREKARAEAQNLRFDSLEKGLNDIKANISKIGWLIVGAVITGAVLFVLKGGLNMVPPNIGP